MANKKAVAAAPKAWQKPTIVFGLVSIQVGIGTIAKDDKLEGHYYDKGSKVRVKQQYVTDDAKARVVSEKLTGYEMDNGEVVFFEAQELADLSTGLKKVVELKGFANENEVDPLYPEASYNVWPDGPGQTKAFVALAAALKEECKVGVGTICLTNSTRLVVLRHSDRVDHLVLQVCTYDDNFLLDRVEAAKAVAAEGPQPSKEELEMTRRFIQMLPVDFHESARTVKDDYQRALKNAAKAKSQGKPVKAGKPVKVPESADLLVALKASLAQAGGAKKKPARKPAVR